MIQKMPKNAENFECKNCNFKCSKLSNYNVHLSTDKHKMMINDINKMPKNAQHYLCNCGKIYKHYSGLWRHQKNCNLNNYENNYENDDENIKITQIVLDVIKQHKESDNKESDNKDSDNKESDNKDELIQYLINENKEFKNLILEIVKKDNINNQNIVNNNITNTNSHNKTFNLQFFLNETCKDAMNMSEFIDSVKLQLSDLESVGKLGFVDGISNIIIKNLEALDVVKRPVHCSDSKRETMYIKEHDKWEKDDSELKQMKDLVRTVRDKNITLIATWRDLYPECVKSNSKKTSQFNQICMEAFGGETGGDKGTKQEKEEKIISKIAKSVIINKS
jgi:hypothetical protein